MRGTVSKMQIDSQAYAANNAQPLRYWLPLSELRMDMSALIGRQLRIAASSGITCVGCGKTSNKSFNQGFCYRCLITLAACDTCIMKPETCHLAAGTCREPEWAERHCQVPHVVYLSNTTGVKVGITRETQIPTRWVDQGAIAALPIFRVANRRLSGLLEVAIAAHVADKTKWQALVKGEVQAVDLPMQWQALQNLCGDAIEAIEAEYPGQIERLAEPAVALHYPVQAFAEKAKTLKPEAEPVEGRLQGIKGQYLLFDTGVLNVRKYTGHEWELTVL